jgi:hypothetical protein
MQSPFVPGTGIRTTLGRPMAKGIPPDMGASAGVGPVEDGRIRSIVPAGVGGGMLIRADVPSSIFSTSTLPPSGPGCLVPLTDPPYGKEISAPPRIIDVDSPVGDPHIPLAQSILAKTNLYAQRVLWRLESYRSSMNQKPHTLITSSLPLVEDKQHGSHNGEDNGNAEPGLPCGGVAASCVQVVFHADGEEDGG